MSNGGGTRARDPKGDKRERILEAAVRVFASKSFYTATVAEIAREAGVADGTIYLYFKNKDDLLICLFEERMGEINEGMHQAVSACERPLDRLKAFIRRHLSEVERRPELAEVLTVELRQSAKLMKEYKATAFGAYLDILSTILDSGLADGSIRPDVDVKAVRRAIFGALDEVALSWLLGGRRFDLGKNAEQLAEIFARGLAA
ncbi:TetR/AcrR family transcriptional regulator [Vulgatibacter sp.]|uniref:TetR/AcrR family transcriptional regulator n=1 Tax=Vulgatibacter sp. TaxID=1971226 RepID=UPI003566B477